MKLRNYQQAAVEAVFESWKSNRSVLVSMATGLGKTVVLSAIIQRLLRESPGRRAMVLAHRSELIEQGQATIHRLTGADVQMEMADCRVVPMFGREPEVVVSTIQTQTVAEGVHEVAIFADNDPAGRHGATALKKILEDALMFRMPFIANIYWPSPQFKDLRAALAEKSSLPIFGKTPLVEV